MKVFLEILTNNLKSNSQVLRDLQHYYGSCFLALAKLRDRITNYYRHH